MVTADFIALPLALWSAFALRFSDLWPSAKMAPSLWLFIAIPFIGVFIFARLGLYRAVVRFMGSQAIWAVVKGVTLLALFVGVAAYFSQIDNFPRSTPISFALSALVYVGGSRLLVRHYYHWLIKHYISREGVIIYGAGGAGLQLATALNDGREYLPVAYVDDDPALWGSTIKEMKVHSPFELSQLVEKYEAKHLLLAIPRATNAERKRILDLVEPLSVHVKTIPSMPEILSGQASLDQVREVDIEELLGRDPVPANKELLNQSIKDKTILVTGAGGSIGSELCRQIVSLSPKTLILFDMNEFGLYQIDKELSKYTAEHGVDVEIYPLLGSVCDRARVRAAIKQYHIDTVYHAAAYKHVPMVEHNIIEGVKNNIIGTQVVAEEALKANVSRFILVSTDKAVRPTNVMGATKRFAELILQSLAHKSSNTVFSMVRFGNVLGSSGSVVPLFRSQIDMGGPITITHKDITRYFMTIPEAASLVIQAGSLSMGGDVFVLDMGASVKIVELAKRLIQLSGLEIRSESNPEGDIELQFTGLRPGEKLYEELLIGSNVSGTIHKKIMRANENSLSIEQVAGFIAEFNALCGQQNNADKLQKLLQKAVVEYTPSGGCVDYLNKDCGQTASVHLIK
ncbi:polysaccharide biosynthesis protein [bacterium]|nr:polysaccharide biosynthesis protein [bacterium]